MIIKNEDLYYTDRPISSKEEDKFDRWLFAERIAQTIAHRKDPSSLVVGIYGVWGDGKTSVLNLMEEAFKNYKDVILIRFNPWYFQSESQLLKGFFETLADTLGKTLNTKVEEIGNALKKYGSIISLASVTLSGGLLQISPGSGLQELGKELSTIELGELRRRIEQILKESGKRIVVLVDDIDRLDRQEIQGIFKLVKLSAGFENTVYVLAFDDEMVANAIGEKYGSGSVESGRSFLEKIIQVSLHLPSVDQISLRQLAFQGVDSALQQSNIVLTEEQVQVFVRYFIDGLEIKLTTPRQAKRYANALAFALPMLRGEVFPVDQMLIEGIRTFYPKLYIVIRDKPDVFLGKPSEHSLDDNSKSKSLETINKGLEELYPREREAARYLLKNLFPRLESVYGNTSYSSEWDEIWEKEKRISSMYYFHRYFQYAIPSKDISEQALEYFLKRVEVSDEATIERNFKEWADKGSTSLLIHKLRRRETTLNYEIVGRLPIYIARHGSVFPVEKGPFVFASTFVQAAILVKRLVQRVRPEKERVELALQIIKEADPLPFAYECFRWLSANKEEIEHERVISVDLEYKLGEIMANRIRDVAFNEPPYLKFPENSSSLFWMWSKYGDRDEVTSYLEGRFVANPQEISKFLASFVGTSWSIESGIPTRSDFGRNSYDSVSEIIDPQIIFEHLKLVYGDALYGTEFYQSRDLSLDEQVVHQFAYIHRGITNALTSSNGEE